MKTSAAKRALWNYPPNAKTKHLYPHASGRQMWAGRMGKHQLGQAAFLKHGYSCTGTWLGTIRSHHSSQLENDRSSLLKRNRDSPAQHLLPSVLLLLPLTVSSLHLKIAVTKPGFIYFPKDTCKKKLNGANYSL